MTIASASLILGIAAIFTYTVLRRPRTVNVQHHQFLSAIGKQSGSGWSPVAGTTLAGGGTPAVNQTVGSTKMNMLLYPSDSGAQFIVGDGNYGCVTGVISYMTTYGFSSTDPNGSTLWINQNQYSRGLFGDCSSSSVRDVSDGTSNTVAMCETTLNVYDGHTPAWGCRAYAGSGIDFANLNGQNKINQWNCCAWPPYSITNPVGRLGEWGSPGSIHSGGMQVLLADGAVRFVSENLDATTRQRLGYIADGNTVGEF